ncbi:hypothetical protein [Deinococcus roseus]|nr:hypothetical protein [Deinococcus roseus]
MPPERPEKPFFRDRSYQEDYFTTHDLKLRGWTATLIRKLVPEHDAEKENLLRIPGRYGSRKVQHPVKLYAQERIKQLEDTEDFYVLYEKAQQALARGAKRREKVLEQKRKMLETTLEGYQPDVQLDLGWHANLRAFKEVLRAHLQQWEAARIPANLVQAAAAEMKARFREAYQQARKKAGTKKPVKKKRSAGFS